MVKHTPEPEHHSPNAKLALAQGAGAVSAWALQHIFHRPAANFPGKIGLAVDHELIGELRTRASEGLIVVVGTNGKTTVTNLLADAIEAAGKTVICNRTGANLDSGIATALMRSHGADWGVLECDELWLAHVLPFLQPDRVVLLNLFRDQLDRVGEIDHIQQSVAAALQASPETTLVYNADDPLCQAIAARVENATVPFGIGESMGLQQNTVSDTTMCQHCDADLVYAWRQYGQLGSYQCPNCGFGRPEPVYAAWDVNLSGESTSLTVRGGSLDVRIEASLAGAYTAYNMLAVCAAADLSGVPIDAVKRAVAAFDPGNGRLQHYEIDGRSVLLNLAKNPTGFNQNLRIIAQNEGPKSVAFFINDKEADGHDVSWLWDVDFQELASLEGLSVYAGGIRRNDMQVRLKYADIPAGLVDGAEDFLQQSQKDNPGSAAYIIANYTSLPHVKKELDRMAANADKASKGSGKGLADSHNAQAASTQAPVGAPAVIAASNRFVIAHMYPTLLNLYGDGGNVTILAKRARSYGLDAEVVSINCPDDANFEDADIVFIGGGPDREQRLASEGLFAMRDQLNAYAQDDGVLLAICGGYQIIGREWLLGEETVPGLGLLDVTTRRAEGGSHNRLVGNITLSSPLATMPVVGYENHAGRTYLGKDCQPFGKVIGTCGKGNNDDDAADGVLWRNVVGTYLHGPLLSKNPEVADSLIKRAVERRAARSSMEIPALAGLDDAIERAANESMCKRLGI